MNHPPEIHVAAFDFDGTLTNGDTLMPFLRHKLGTLRLGLSMLRCLPWLVGYACGMVSNHQAKSKLLQISLKGLSTPQGEQLAADFVKHQLPELWRTEGLQALLKHQHAGHRTLLVSASPCIYLVEVARVLGVTDLICTDLGYTAPGIYSGEIVGLNCHGEEKARRLKLWLQLHCGHSNVVLYAYGDTRGDWPMLRLAQRAWYRDRPWVDPMAHRTQVSSHP
jgi:phosphatidylglycerophosphatase C